MTTKRLDQIEKHLKKIERCEVKSYSESIVAYCKKVLKEIRKANNDAPPRFNSKTDQRHLYLWSLALDLLESYQLEIDLIKDLKKRKQLEFNK